MLGLERRDKARNKFGEEVVRSLSTDTRYVRRLKDLQVRQLSHLSTFALILLALTSCWCHQENFREAMTRMHVDDSTRCVGWRSASAGREEERGNTSFHLFRKRDDEREPGTTWKNFAFFARACVAGGRREARWWCVALRRASFSERTSMERRLDVSVMSARVIIARQNSKTDQSETFLVEFLIKCQRSHLWPFSGPTSSTVRTYRSRLLYGRLLYGCIRTEHAWEACWLEGHRMTASEESVNHYT